MNDIFVVIPAYNEAKTIGHIVKGLVGKGLRVVVVDDGSKDHTIVEANRFGAELIVHSKNRGKGQCIREGLEYCLENGCEAVITMDGDGQHDIKEIDNFIKIYKESNADIVIGNRMHCPKKMPFIRRLTNIIMSFILSYLLRFRIDDSQCGFRLLSKRAIETMSLRTTRYEIESEMLVEAIRHNLKIASLNIDSIYHGQSSQINPFLDTFRFIRFVIYEFFWRRFRISP